MNFRKLDSLSQEIDELQYRPLGDTNGGSGAFRRGAGAGLAVGGVGSPESRRPPLAAGVVHGHGHGDPLYSAQDDQLAKLETRVVTQVEGLLSRQRAMERSMHEGAADRAAVLRKRDAELLALKRGVQDAHAEVRDQFLQAKGNMDAQRQAHQRLKARVARLESASAGTTLDLQAAATGARVEEQVRTAVQQAVSQALGDLAPRLRQLEEAVERRAEEAVSAQLEARLAGMQRDLAQLPRELHQKWKGRMAAADTRLKDTAASYERRLEALTRCDADLLAHYGDLEARLEQKLQRLELGVAASAGGGGDRERERERDVATLSAQVAQVARETRAWREESERRQAALQRELAEQDQVCRQAAARAQQQASESWKELEERVAAQLQREDTARRQALSDAAAAQRAAAAAREDHAAEVGAERAQLEKRLRDLVGQAHEHSRQRLESLTAALEHEKGRVGLLEQGLAEVREQSGRSAATVQRLPAVEQGLEQLRVAVLQLNGGAGAGGGGGGGAGSKVSRSVREYVDRAAAAAATAAVDGRGGAGGGAELRREVAALRDALEQSRRDQLATFEQVAKRERAARGHSEQVFAARAAALEQQVYASVEKLAGEYRQDALGRHDELAAERAKEVRRLDGERAAAQQQLEEYVRSERQSRQQSDEDAETRRRAMEERVDSRAAALELRLDEMQRALAEERQRGGPLEARLDGEVRRLEQRQAQGAAEAKREREREAERLAEWKREEAAVRERMGAAMKQMMEEIRVQLAQGETRRQEDAGSWKIDVARELADMDARVRGEVQRLRADVTEQQERTMELHQLSASVHGVERGVRQALDDCSSLRAALKERVDEVQHSVGLVRSEVLEAVDTTHSQARAQVEKVQALANGRFQELQLAAMKEAHACVEARGELRDQVVKQVRDVVAGAEEWAKGMRAEAEQRERLAREEEDSREQERRRRDEARERELAERERERERERQREVDRVQAQFEAARQEGERRMAELAAEERERTQRVEAAEKKRRAELDEVQARREREYEAERRKREAEEQKWEAERQKDAEASAARMAAVRAELEERLAAARQEMEREQAVRARERKDEEDAMKAELEAQRAAWAEERKRQSVLEQERIEGLRKEDAERVRKWDEERQAALALEEERLAALKAGAAAQLEKRREEEEAMKAERQREDDERRRELEEKMSVWERERQEGREWREREIKEREAREKKEREAREEDRRAEKRAREEQEKRAKEARAEEKKEREAREKKDREAREKREKEEKRAREDRERQERDERERQKKALKDEALRHKKDVEAVVKGAVTAVEERQEELARALERLEKEGGRVDELVERQREAQELLDGMAASIAREELDLDRCVSEIKSLKAAQELAVVEEQERLHDALDKARDELDSRIETLRDAADKAVGEVGALARRMEGVDNKIDGKFKKFQLQIGEIGRRVEGLDGKCVQWEMARKRVEKRVEKLEG